MELDESSRIPVGFARAKTKQRHLGSGRGRLAHETCGISAGGLRGASKCRTRRGQPAGLRETSCVAARRARNQRFCEECEQAQDQQVYARGACVRANGTLGTSKRGGIRGRPIAAGRTYKEVAFSGIKGGRAFRILQSKHSEHPFGGTCTARHRARTQRDKRRAPRLASLRRPEKDTHRVKKGVFKTLMQGTGGVY